MLVKTEIYQRFLEKEGYRRDAIIPFTFNGPVGFSHNDGRMVFMDEEYIELETDHLIEDAVASENYELADKIQKWVAAGAP